MFKTTKLDIPDVIIIEPRLFKDYRGYFREVLHERTFRELVADVHFVQDNEALSTAVGTIRGLHFQKPPAAHGKLVRALAGKVFDVAVDIRKGSPTFGKYVSTQLDAESANMVWIPPGFAHGYCTLEPNSIVAYKITDFYSPENDTGIAWNDPTIDIKWPVDLEKVVISDKDRALPTLDQADNYFQYQSV